MSRRCVVCGKEIAEHGVEAYHAPKNIREARIWQRTINAFETPVESILSSCCVCIRHIPQFVEMAQKQAMLIKAHYDEKAKEKEKARTYDKLSRPSLNVLLLAGATVSKENLKDGKLTMEGDKLNEEIVVRQSCLSDCGVSFPGLDETEITLLRTQDQEEQDLQQQLNSDQAESEQCDDIGSNCTDVLLLGRNQCDLTDICPCNCSHCSKLQIPPDNPAACLPPQPGLCYEPAPQGLEEIILRQQKRICELEQLIYSHNDWHLSMQRKLFELYSEFGIPEATENVNHSSTALQEQQQSLNSNTLQDQQLYGTTSLSNVNCCTSQSELEASK